MSSESAELFRLLDTLIDCWCERRALVPLRELLGACPPIPVHTDQWGELYTADRNLRGLHLVLPREDSATVSAANAAIYQRLKHTAAGRGILDAAG